MKFPLMAVSIVAVSFSSCVNGPSPGTYITTSTESKKGLVTHIHTHQGTAAASSPRGRVGSLQGIALRHSILGGLVSWGTDSVGAAAQKAAPEFRYRNSPNEGIREVDTVGRGGVRILWGLLYSNEQTVVTGEGTTSESSYEK